MYKKGLNLRNVIKMILVCLAVVLVFASCNKSNEIVKDDQSLIFIYRCSSGWVGLDENLKISSDSTYYSFYHELAEISYHTSIKTSKEQWDNLTKAFNLETFTKIQNESCGLIYDIPTSRFSVSINGEIYSFYNGECDKYFKQMQGFFDLIFEQKKSFRNNVE